MDVAQVMKMVKERKGTMSYEVFGREVGINGTTLFKMITEAEKDPDRDLAVSNFRSLMLYFHKTGDFEMVKILIEYGTGLSPEALTGVLSSS